MPDIGLISDFTFCRFLLARLTFDSLVGHRTPKAIKGALDKISGGSGSLDSAYDDAMKRIEDQDPASRELAKKTLLWISQGQRLLSVAEMQQAVAIELGDSDLDPDSEVDCDDIISACTGLVTEDRSIIRDYYDPHRFRLVHYTTQEYLERTMMKHFPKAQEYLASSCLTYLLFDVFSGALCPPCQDDVRSNFSGTGVGNKAKEVFCFGCKKCWTGEHHEVECRTRSSTDPCASLRHKQYPFYDYAARYWGHHTENCDDEAILILTKTFLDDALRVSGAFAYLLHDVDYAFDDVRLKLEDSNPGSAMQLAAFLGLTEVVSKRLEDGCRPDIEDWSGKTPFSWAVNRGHEHVVNRLMTRKDFNPNVRDRHGRTPLIEAVRRGHVAVVQLLLACEYVDINARDRPGETALHTAAEGARVEEMQLLLAHGDIQINTRDDKGQTALHIAAKGEMVEEMRLLLAHGGIQINIRDEWGQTALYIAAQQDWVEGIQHLLALDDIQVNERNNKGRTALHIAAQRASLEQMQLLLAHDNIQINTRDKWGQTVLHIAAQRASLEQMQLLLAHDNIQIDIRDNWGQTVLHIAAECQDFKAVQLLLAHENLDVNATADNGATALFGAVSNTPLTELFLARGDVNLNIRDMYGHAPLYHAVVYRQPDVVQLLLTRQDLEISIEDGEGEILVSTAENLRDMEEGKEFDACNTIISLLRSYFQQRSSNRTSANTTQQD